jgi:MYXO-CTERM domain-containing protein
MRSALASSAVLVACLVSAAASAHIKLVAPEQRYPEGPPSSQEGDQKTGPCGSGPATGAVTTYAPGETITVIWQETVNHPGHFRISLDPDGGDDGLVDPTDYDDFYVAPTVLLDDITDGGGSNFSESITLPMTECDKCTLQLIQIMTDKPPWGPAGGNDIYYQCADISIKAGGGTGGGGVGGAGSGGESSGSGPSGPSGAGGGTGSGTPTSPASSGGAESDGGCSMSSRGHGTSAAMGIALLAALGLASRRRRSPGSSR